VNKKKLPKAIRSTADEMRAGHSEPAASDSSPVIGSPARAERTIEVAPPPPIGTRNAVAPVSAPSPPLTGVVIHPGSPADAEFASIDSEHRLMRAQAIVERHATYSALGGIIPLPIVNVGAVTTVILRMVKLLSELYGVPFERDRARAVVLGLMGGTMPTGLAAATTSTLIYIIPGSNLIGLAVSSIAAAACTRSIGRIFVERFEDGGNPQHLDPRPS
jgi:uncharacterized protein (DUF697 family)